MVACGPTRLTKKVDLGHHYPVYTYSSNLRSLKKGIKTIRIYPPLIPRICDGDDELHELLYGDNPVPVPVRQAEDLSGDAAGGHDAVEGVGADGGVLEREV